jgi:hypothetical protein
MATLTLEAHARLFVSRHGSAILYRVPLPQRDGDIAVTDDLHVAEPVWRKLVIAIPFGESARHALRYGDPSTQTAGWLRLEDGVLWYRDAAHFATVPRITHVRIAPFPPRMTARLVGEIPETGARVAVLSDPDRPLAATVRVLRGDRARPTDWEPVQVGGVDGSTVATAAGLVDLRSRAWDGWRLRLVPEDDWGLDIMDAWGKPLPAHTGDVQARWALVALAALLVGLILGIGLGVVL